jgi:hypothetical protein
LLATISARSRVRAAVVARLVATLDLAAVGLASVVSGN